MSNSTQSKSANSLIQEIGTSLTQIGLGRAADKASTLATFRSALARLIKEHPDALTLYATDARAADLAGLVDEFNDAVAVRRDVGPWNAQVHCFSPRGSQLVARYPAPGGGLALIVTGAQNVGIISGSNASNEDDFIQELFANAREMQASINDISFNDVGSHSVFMLEVTRPYDIAMVLGQLRYIGLHNLKYIADEFIDGYFSVLIESRRIVDMKQFGSYGRVSYFKQYKDSCSAKISYISCVKINPSKFSKSVHDAIRQAINSMLTECGESNDYKSSSDVGEFKLLLSIEAEKRGWIEQFIALKSLVKALARRYRRIRVFINGMTGWVEGVDASFYPNIRALEESFISELRTELPDVEVEHLFGFSFAKKVCALKEIDFFAAPLGNACLIPTFLNIPGVIYGSKDFISTMKHVIFSENAISIPENMTRNIDDKLNMMSYEWSVNTPQGLSYSIDSDDFVEFCLNHIDRKKAV